LRRVVPREILKSTEYAGKNAHATHAWDSSAFVQKESEEKSENSS
jgi:hypothetical protein